MLLSDLLAYFEHICSKDWAFEGDPVGLTVGDPAQEIHSALFTLDPSSGAVEQVIQGKFDVLVSHHPLIYTPLKSVSPSTAVGESALKLAKHGIAAFGLHTNWDCAPGGINDTLAHKLGLGDVRQFGPGREQAHFKMVVGVPAAQAKQVRTAAAEAGAGRLGNYSHCAFSQPGTGTFRPLQGANPAIGKVGEQEEVEEVRIEMLVDARLVDQVDGAVRQAHPYEEPAIDFYPLKPTVAQRIGRIGTLGAMPLSAFSTFCSDVLGHACLAWGDSSRSVSKVAVIGGAADDEWRSAQAAGADVFVTGEVRQHVAVEASHYGMAVIAAGHFATEHPGMVALAERTAKAFPSIKCEVFEPSAGEHGRPY